jgi:hypothetical protein
MALVKKHGRVVDIPVRARTVVRTRESRSGKLTDQKAIVVGTAPASDFSRAYGRQVYVCQVFGKSKAYVSTTGAGDLYPVGTAKRIPKVCKDALAEFEASYPTLARRRKGRSR